MLSIFRYCLYKKSKHILKSKKGMALLSVLIFSFILVAVVVSMLTMAQNDTKRSTLQRDSTKAFYLAESGIEQTLWKINNPDNDDRWTITNDSVNDGGIIVTGTDWDIPYYNPSINDKEYYKVEITPTESVPEGDEIKDWVYIKSTGVVKGNEVKVSGKRTVKVKAHYTSTQNPSVLYDKAILVDASLDIKGGEGGHGGQGGVGVPPIITGGDIHSNGSITQQGRNFVFEGTATTSGEHDPEDPNASDSSLNDLDNTENGDFSGPGNWPAIPIPEVPYDALKVMAEANGTYFLNGFDSTKDGVNFTGVVYVVGDFLSRPGESINITDGALIVAKVNPDDPGDVTGNVDFCKNASLTIDRTPEDELTYPLPENYYPGPIALAAQGNIQFHFDSAASTFVGVIQSGGYYKDGDKQPGGFVEFHSSVRIDGCVVAEEVWMHSGNNINYDADYMNNFTDETGDYLYKKTSWQEVY